MPASSTSDDATLRVGAVVDDTAAEGPGRRFAVWLAGCSIRCDGCFNPNLWNPNAGNNVLVSELLTRVHPSPVEGITLLGGEPFEQATAAAALARGAQKFGKSVMTFTGYTFEFLQGPDAPAGSDALLEATDLLVDGPYLADKPDLLRPWVGSSNQHFRFLSGRYQDLAGELAQLPDRIEVRIDPAGLVHINGWARVDQLDALLEASTPPISRGKIR